MNNWSGLKLKPRLLLKSRFFLFIEEKVLTQWHWNLKRESAKDRKRESRETTEMQCVRTVCEYLCVFLQSIMLLLHSQRRYVFEYDQTDRLVAVTMPSMVKHTLQSLLSIGYYRNIYAPPDSQASFIQDYTLDGRLMRTQYLGTGRRVIYRCGTSLF